MSSLRKACLRDQVLNMRVTLEPGRRYTLPPLVDRAGRAGKGGTGTSHIFAKADIDVVNAALATGRPLLLRGEPGIGKSQLARAVAQLTGRAFVSTVVDARTEPRDLLYRYDAVRRLAAAQVYGQLETPTPTALDESHFVEPGPLWWAFSWTTAHAQMKRAYKARGGEGDAPTPWPGTDPEAHGVVVLIDEIDKADPSVPNGLLEALGQGCFHPMGRSEPIDQTGPTPLVVITSNEERTLPGAFLRRCWVREIRPEGDLAQWLSERGSAHFPKMKKSVVTKAVAQLMGDRANLKGRHLTPPGQAELIDLLRALDELGPEERTEGQTLEQAQLDLLERLAPFALKKHPKAQPVAAARSRSGEDQEPPSS